MLASNVQLKVGWVSKCFLAFLKKTTSVVLKTTIYTKNAFVVKVSRSRLVGLLGLLHSHLLCQYTSLADILVYDNPSKLYRFAVTYSLLSLAFNSRLAVCVYTNPGLPVATSCYVYAAAAWLEREAWDLYGIFFVRHPDLRKILTDYGFNHHPLRKDFPLAGYKEGVYSQKENRTLYRGVKLTQAYRVFAFKGAWLKYD